GRGVVHRVHGGAVSVDSLTMLEPPVTERDVTAAAEKDRIAHAALELLPGAGGSVILDGGTTTGRLAALLPVDRPLTVVTNAATVAAVITARTSSASRLELHIVGGRVRPVSQVTVGASALAVLDALRADVSFLG